MSKLRDILADMDDYCGFHFSANSMRNGKTGKKWMTFQILIIWNYPLQYLIMSLTTWKFHKPDCDCKEMKILRELNEIEVKLKNIFKEE